MLWNTLFECLATDGEVPVDICNTHEFLSVKKRMETYHESVSQVHT